MFSTLLSDPDKQHMVAVEESRTPPATNRVPHIVCQLCRSKKVQVPESGPPLVELTSLMEALSNS